MATRRAAFIYCSDLDAFHYPDHYPLKVIRSSKTLRTVDSMGLLEGDNREIIHPTAADRSIMGKFHTARYLDTLDRVGQGKFNHNALLMGIGSGDCPAFRGVYDYSSLVCGATLCGARLLLEDRFDVAFNPAGGLHHAFPERASGFCYLNDVVLGCLVLAEAGRRVLYLDIDVHHGDGPQYAFYSRSDVLTLSFHESGRTLFPGTGYENEIGRGEGEGYSVNVPLPVGTYDEAYLKAFRAVALPLISAFDPDVIVFELGADALAGDPLAHLSLTNNTYAEIINHLLQFGKPLLATGGGGYHVQNTVRAWALAWSIFADGDTGSEAYLGLGGVMLESTDWQGGLRDRDLLISSAQRKRVMPVVDETIKAVQTLIFPFHGL